MFRSSSSTIFTAEEVKRWSIFEHAISNNLDPSKFRQTFPASISEFSFASSWLDLLDLQIQSSRVDCNYLRPFLEYLQSCTPGYARLYILWSKLEFNDGNVEGANAALMAGMRVNAQPSMDMTLAYSKFVNRNQLLVPSNLDDSNFADKENIPWEQEKRAVSNNNPVCRCSLHHQEPLLNTVHKVIDAIVHIEKVPEDSSVQPPLETKAAAISLSFYPTQKKMPVFDPLRRKNLGRRLGPPLRTSTSSIDTAPEELLNTSHDAMKPSVEISPPVSAIDKQFISHNTEQRSPVRLGKPLLVKESYEPDVVAKKIITSETQMSSVSLTTPPQDKSEIKTEKARIVINGHVYLKTELIGKGGSSKVFKITSSQTGKTFALKRVKLKGLDRESIDGLKNEVLLLKKLSNNDRIIKLYDSEILPDFLYMVLEYGEVDLASMLNGKKNKPGFIKLYWEQMLRAVLAIHEENIIHSDLKPANFILVAGDLKLIDFGIAKSIANDTTNIHRDHQTGTVNYMSPEAIHSNAKDFRLGRSSDVWSLGCILYQLVYGNPPFHHFEKMGQKMHAIADPLHKITYPEIPTNEGRPLMDVMKSCLRFEPKARITIPQLLAHSYITGAFNVKTALGSPQSMHEWGIATLKIFECVQDEYCTGERHDLKARKDTVNAFLRMAIEGIKK